MITTKEAHVLMPEGMVLPNGLAVPVAEDGHYWRGINHGLLVNLIEEGAERRFWKLGKSTVFVSPGGSDMVASWDIDINLAPPDCCSFSIGVVNSNSRQTALHLFAGLRVAANDVGLPFFKFVLGKHTKGLLLSKEVNQALTQCGELFHGIEKLINEMDKRALLLPKATEMLTKIARQRQMPWSRIGEVDKLFREGPLTALSLLYSFAYVARKNPPLRQMRQIHELYKLIEDKRSA